MYDLTKGSGLITEADQPSKCQSNAEEETKYFRNN